MKLSSPLALNERQREEELLALPFTLALLGVGPVAVMKHQAVMNSLEERVYFGLQLTAPTPAAERSQGRSVKSGTRAEGHGEVLLILLACPLMPQDYRPWCPHLQ